MELARLEVAWRDCDAAKAVPELATLARSLDQATAPHRRPRKVGWRPAMAAAAAVALTAGALWWRLAPAEEAVGGTARPGYKVLASGAKRLVFDDDSVAEVRDHGSVRTEFTAEFRRVWLESGEAHFTVAKDPSRPFIVAAGGIEVRALGTAFNVRVAAADVDVLVTEGTVRVAPAAEAAPVSVGPAATAILDAGERAVFERRPTPGVA